MISDISLRTILSGFRLLGETPEFLFYDWEEGNHVLKIAKDSGDHPLLLQEFQHTNLVHTLGIPSGRPVRLIRIGDHPGLIREKLTGATLTDRFRRALHSPIDLATSEILRMDLRTYAKVLHKVHTSPEVRLRSQIELLEEQIRNQPHLIAPETRAILSHLQTLPRARNLCHGTPHPDNLFFTARGPVLTDWGQASSGFPGADLAHLWLVFKHAEAPTALSERAVAMFDRSRCRRIQTFFEEYFRLSSLSWFDVEPWILPMAASKLSAPGTTENERHRLLEEIRSRIPVEVSMISHSERLLNKARSMVQPLFEDCQSVAVVGSAARCQADRYSDIEIELFVDSLPSPKEREDLVCRLGGTRISHHPVPLADGSLWSVFFHQGVWVELGWQDEASAVAVLDSVRDGETTRQDLLILVSTYHDAVWIRESEKMRACRSRLTRYPPERSQAIIREILDQWDVELTWQVKAALAHRGDRLALVQRYLCDCHRIIRVIFALNQAWERDLKGIGKTLGPMKIKPENLLRRMESLFSQPNTRNSNRVLARLVDDTVRLIPDTLEIRETRERLLGYCRWLEAELSG